MKSNVEHTIKNLLNEREIPVSENAWDRLQEMMEEPQEKKVVTKSRRFKIWMPLSIAASVILFLGVFFGWDSEQKKPLVSQTQTQLFENKIQEVESIAQIPTSKEIYADSSLETGISEEKISNTNSEKKAESFAKVEKEVVEPKVISIQEIQEEIKIPDVLKETPKELLVQEVTQPEVKKKTNFVDPEMLLYSIENNEAVKQSNSTSRLVLYDFNK
jgi:hypothetical protein